MDAEPMTTLLGSCLCGAVAYQAKPPFTSIARCHCVQCRKASGAEYATNASVEKPHFEILEGADRIRSFESSPSHPRHFCGDCGSPLYSAPANQPDHIRIRLGTLDSAFDEPVQIRVFTREKLGLSAVPDDGIPTFETTPRP